MRNRLLALTFVLCLGFVLMSPAFANNGSRYFDGVSYNNVVKIGDMTNHLIRQFTFEVWFKTEKGPDDDLFSGDAHEQTRTLQRGRTLFASSGVINKWPAWLSLHKDTLKFYAFMNNTSTYNNKGFEYRIPNMDTDTWYHVAVSAGHPDDEDASGFMRMYINGEPVANENPDAAQFVEEGTAITYSGGDGKWLQVMSIGDLREERGYIFHGWMDDARIWKVERTPEQIRDNYLNPLSDPADLEDLVGYWKFDEQEGETAVNSSGKLGVGGISLDGEVTGGTWAEDNLTFPVELSAFYATINSQNHAHLTWVTETETAVLGFKVLRNDERDLENAFEVSPLIDATNSSLQHVYEFTDTSVFPGRWYYWLQNLDLNGVINYFGPVIVDISEDNNITPDIPLVSRIQRVFPNPFNPNTTISYELAEPAEVSFKIFNTRGQLVQNYDVGQKSTGRHNLVWNAQDLSTGVYIIEMKAGDHNYKTKAVLSK